MRDEHIVALVRLTTLKLSNSENITDEGLRQLTAITHLDLCENRSVTTLAVTRLGNLQVLGLRRNTMIYFVPDQVRDLDIRGNSIITGKKLQLLTTLTALTLDANDIITGDDISVLTNLTSISLNYNMMISNAGITHMTKLKDIYLYGNTQIQRYKLGSEIRIHAD